ncbi:MAG TPA: hypothetical protein VFN03_09540 [Trueperaceae bacterium]|nr:hypothetical protein [Trueperaceae bacterium]
MIAATQPSAVRTVSLSAVAVAATLVFPYLVHLLPAGQGPQVGATYLPIYWAPLLAALLFGFVPALAAAALGPIVNHWVTGSPPEFLLTSMTLELVGFVIILKLLLTLAPRNLLAVPLAYLAARVLVTVAQRFSTLTSASTWAGLGSSLQTALPGIAILTVVGAALVWWTARRPAVK